MRISQIFLILLYYLFIKYELGSTRPNHLDWAGTGPARLSWVRPIATQQTSLSHSSLGWTLPNHLGQAETGPAQARMVEGPTQRRFSMQMAMVFQQNKEEKKATWCGRWLVASAGKSGVQLVATMAVEAWQKKWKKTVGEKKNRNQKKG